MTTEISFSGYDLSVITEISMIKVTIKRNMRRVKSSESVWDRNCSSRLCIVYVDFVEQSGVEAEFLEGSFFKKSNFLFIRTEIWAKFIFCYHF